MSDNLTWVVCPFSKLSTTQLYQAIKLRIDVFVVEQTCYYSDLDDRDWDTDALHFLLYEDEALIGYLRVLPPGCAYDNYASIGRFALASSARGKGIAHQMIKKANQLCQQQFPKHNIKISAQQYLTQFYQQHGYHIVSDVYLEDGIPHVSMVKNINE